MAVVIITGGTGMIGKALTKELLKKGYDVIILSRRIAAGKLVDASRIRYALWNIDKHSIDISAIQQADYVIHLAGASIADKRWTPKRKKEIVDSRTRSSGLLVKALKENPNKVKAVISSSAIGWYGADPEPRGRDNEFVETDAADENFLGQTCKLWEESIKPVKLLGKRLVKLRTGIVLSNEGGAYVEFKKPLRFGIAGILGNGKQVISWIHIDDLVRLYSDAIENEKLHGVYNAVAPHPITNKEMVLQLAKKIRGSFYIPIHVPGFVLRLMLGEISTEILKSATVSCEKIHEAGFTFQYPTIQAAIRQLEASQIHRD